MEGAIDPRQRERGVAEHQGDRARPGADHLAGLGRRERVLHPVRSGVGERTFHAEAVVGERLDVGVEGDRIDSSIGAAVDDRRAHGGHHGVGRVVAEGGLDVALEGDAVGGVPVAWTFTPQTPTYFRSALESGILPM